MSQPRTLSNALTLHFIFAAAVIALNVGVQKLVVTVLGENTPAIWLSIFMGTGAGLVVKYLLDKLIIYRQTVSSAGTEGKSFTLYTLTGLFTTLLFWAIEYSFYLVTGSENWRYIGAVLGLIIGYTIKFFIDKNLIFNPEKTN